MKTSELMLGDYLYVWPSNMVIKVAAIHKGKVGYHACTNKLSWVRVGLLRPIPLSIEILEKNGFKKDEKSENMYYWNWSISDNCVSYDKETSKVRVFHTLGSLVFVEPLSFLHELQNALTICGIEKEIEI